MMINLLDKGADRVHTAGVPEELLFIDLEGTGGDDGPREEIVEICLLKVRGKRVLEHFSSLVNPGRPVPSKPWIPHRITTPTLASAPWWSELAPQVAERVDS
ncbi:MAG: exonuclease domain-containing protein, partial [Sulfobacillus sp.]